MHAGSFYGSMYENEYHTYAMKMVSVCPSLGYIMIEKFAWRVVKEYGVSPSCRRDLRVIRLKRLDKHEIRDIEVFKMKGRATETGLMKYEGLPPGRLDELLGIWFMGFLPGWKRRCAGNATLYYMDFKWSGSDRFQSA
jgi:hypothetical protein